MPSNQQIGNISLEDIVSAHDSASRQATQYITETSNGIFVHPEGVTSDGIRIDNDMTIEVDGEICAEFADDHVAFYKEFESGTREPVIQIDDAGVLFRQSYDTNWLFEVFDRYMNLKFLKTDPDDTATYVGVPGIEGTVTDADAGFDYDQRISSPTIITKGHLKVFEILAGTHNVNEKYHYNPVSQGRMQLTADGRLILSTRCGFSENSPEGETGLPLWNYFGEALSQYGGLDFDNTPVRTAMHYEVYTDGSLEAPLFALYAEDSNAASYPYFLALDANAVKDVSQISPTKQNTYIRYFIRF